MNYQVWGFPLAIVASFFFLAAFCKVAAKEMPEPPKKPPTPEPEPIPEPFVSWRIVMEQFEGITVPSTIALDMNPTTEKYLGTHEWVKLP